MTNPTLLLELNPPEGMTMDHNEALKQMAAERYLLDELSPELRDEFEEHAFDCPECALDLRAGSVFMQEAKEQLTHLPAPETEKTRATEPRKPRRSFWNLLFQPAFAAPVFALLLGVVAYQNLATIPQLRSAANEPRVLPWVSVHTGTRAAARTLLPPNTQDGAILILDTPENQSYTSYAFELYDPQGKQIWSKSIPVPGESAKNDGTLSLFIPGSALQQGSDTLTISGVTSQGVRTRIDQRVLEVRSNTEN